MARGKRLSKEQKREVDALAPSMRELRVTSTQREDMIRARRAFIANCMVRRRDMADITLMLALPVGSGGLGISVSEATIARDMKAIRDEWESDARKQIRHGLIDELAKLNYLDSLVTPQPGAQFDAQQVAASLAVTDRRVKLLGLDLETRSKLSVSSDGPLSSADINSVLERARAARERIASETTIDVVVSTERTTE